MRRATDMAERLARVAVAAPLRALFDYRVPDGVVVAAGCRVRVPFGRSRAIGVVVELPTESGVAHDRLKPLDRVLDAHPLLAADHLAFLRWVAGYYHHPVGEVVAAALPRRLRKAERVAPLGEPGWELTAAGR
ncbi:MAG: primosomal protein N', partial [Gammaproteobacteria bacterium]|nr:primosomal protein N' [Gammaproteobacteria bacterium]